MLAIIGLGNPDEKYLDTRHNAGFMVIDILSTRWKVKLRESFKHSVYTKKNIAGNEILLVKPITYMNRSGWAAKEIREKLELFPEEFLIVYDDMDIPTENIRIRKQGSSGGHNGLQSILDELGTSNVPRLRIGIDSPSYIESGKDWVLSPVPPESQMAFERTIFTAADAVETILREGYEKAMGKFNKKQKEDT